VQISKVVFMCVWLSSASTILGMGQDEVREITSPFIRKAEESRRLPVSLRNMLVATSRVVCSGMRGVVERCWRGRHLIIVCALVVCAATIMPCAMAVSTDTSVAYGGLNNVRPDARLQTDYCGEIVGAVGDVLRLNVRRCWPEGVAHLDGVVAEHLQMCLSLRVGTLSIPRECYDALHPLMMRYSSLFGGCIMRCMSPSYSCLTREYAAHIDPFAYCTGPGCVDACVGDELSWSDSRYTNALIRMYTEG